MSQLTEFYRGTGTDHRGRTVAEIQAFDDHRLESTHDFIQWLFPLEEPSAYNPHAPLLTTADVAAFRSDPALWANLARSFAVFLAFLGLRLDEATGRVAEAGDFGRKAGIWRAPNHNWLRITRVLASTRRLGLDRESRALFAFLRGLREGGRSGITDETFRYWQQAAGPETTR
jgi:hypothetical protein